MSRAPAIACALSGRGRWPDLRRAGLLGLVHALVDATSLALLYHEVSLDRLPYETLCSLVLLYNCLAFGLQAPLGWLSDHLGRRHLFAVAGTMLAALAVSLSSEDPFTSAVTMGLGNALFHVGAGAIVLRRCGGRAAGPGLFVGPGAFGVWLGIWLGMHQGFHQPIFIGTMLAAGVVLLAIGDPAPEPGWDDRRGSTGLASAMAVACALALLASVGVRSLAGGALAGAASARGPFVVLALALAAVGGKAMGGFAADAGGWRRVAVGSLLLAWPISGWALGDTAAGVAAVILLQASMPVTLTAVYRIWHRRPGLAMGLPSLALLIGALPSQVEGFPLEPSRWLWLLLPLSAGLLYLGLRFVEGAQRPAAAR